MTPADHGFQFCSRCACWRRPDAVEPNGNKPVEGWMCRDVAWCSQQAGAGKGALDADTGAPDAKRLPDDAWSRSSIP